MPMTSPHPWTRYALAIATALLALAANLASWPLFAGFPYMLFLAAVLISSRWGFGPGLLTTAISIVTSWYFLIPPLYTFSAEPSEAVGLVGFALVSILMVMLTSQLASAEQRNRRVLESISEGFYVVDRMERVTYVNSVGASFLGLRPDQIVGQTLNELFPALEPDEAPGLEALRQVMRDGQSRRLQTRYKDRWFDISLSPAEEGVISFSRDVTESRRSASKLRENEERLRLVIEAGKIGVWDWDIRSNRVEWTQRTYEIHGVAPGAFGGSVEDFFSMVHEEDAERVRAAVEQALSDGAFEAELRIRRPSGEVRWLYTRAEVDVEDGKPVRMLGATFDMTDLVAARREVQAAEGRFRRMADVAPVKIWMSGSDKGVTWLNRRWLEFRGRRMEEEVGDGWTDGLHPDDRETCLELYRSAFDAREPFRVESRLLRHDGAYRWVLMHGVPMLSGSGTLSGYIVSGIDITDRRDAEQGRERLLEAERVARAEAERVNRIKDEFLATLSHELRTPLQSVLGWSRLLLGSDPDPGRRTRALESIERNALIQAQLIEDLLDMSRIVSGAVRLDVQRVALKPVIEAAIETIRPAAEAKTIRIRSVLDPLAGPVSGDPQRLQQVIWNLLSNAVKFTPKNGRIEVLLERVNSHVEITVSDSGQGIAPEFLPYVFDRFRQQDAGTTRQHQGLGLGLAIVRHLVELHGGSVRAQSAGDGQGASFVVALPVSAVHERAVHEPDRAHPRAPAPETRVKASEPSLAGVRVLVVEDEDDSRDVLRQVLHDCGAVVDVARTAAEALSFLEQRVPDVILSDIGMPEIDGYEFIRIVRALPVARGGRVPAIALTAFARSEDRTRALLAGYQVHAAKPIQPDELVATVYSLARSSQEDRRSDSRAPA